MDTRVLDAKAISTTWGNSNFDDLSMSICGNFNLTYSNSNCGTV